LPGDTSGGGGEGREGLEAGRDSPEWRGAATRGRVRSPNELCQKNTVIFWSIFFSFHLFFSFALLLISLCWLNLSKKINVIIF
jgi:hypothetical protein